MSRIPSSPNSSLAGPLKDPAKARASMSPSLAESRDEEFEPPTATQLERREFLLTKIPD